jgi:hypothetical protein
VGDIKEDIILIIEDAEDGIEDSQRDSSESTPEYGMLQ